MDFYNLTIGQHRNVEKFILSFLGPKELFSLRVVCKRWKKLLDEICDIKYKCLCDAAKLLSRTKSKTELLYFNKHLPNIRYDNVVRIYHMMAEKNRLFFNKIVEMRSNWINNIWHKHISTKYYCHFMWYRVSSDLTDPMVIKFLVYENLPSNCTDIFYALGPDEYYKNVDDGGPVRIKREEFTNYEWESDNDENDIVEDTKERNLICDLIDKFYMESDIIKVFNGDLTFDDI